MPVEDTAMPWSLSEVSVHLRLREGEIPGRAHHVEVVAHNVGQLSLAWSCEDALVSSCGPEHLLGDL